MRDESQSGKEVGPGVRYVPPEAVDPAMAASRQAAETRANRQHERDSSAPGADAHPVRLAVTSEELPAGAIAMVVRDPGSRTPRLLVFSEQSLDDAAFILADMALRRDERVHVGAGTRRVLLVARDQSVRTADGAHLGELGLENVFGGSRHFTARLLDEARIRPETLVPGVGRVRLAASH